MSKITINVDGRVLYNVPKDTYVSAKTKDLKNFGYKNLTEKEVAAQLENVLNDGELDVIGRFIEQDIVK